MTGDLYDTLRDWQEGLAILLGFLLLILAYLVNGRVVRARERERRRNEARAIIAALYGEIVVLREKEADRYLTIWIGADVADAIAFRLQDVTAARPQTHDLFLKMLEELGGKVEAVVVNDLREDTFYANIQVRRGEDLIEIDSRPSDAIAIAVRAGVPIYVADEVMDRAGIVLDEDGEPVEGAGEGGERPAPPSAEELEKLSAFRDFVAGLDLDDLGEGSR